MFPAKFGAWISVPTNDTILIHETEAIQKVMIMLAKYDTFQKTICILNEIFILYDMLSNDTSES